MANLESVLLVEVVFAEIIQGFAQALDRLVGTTAGIGFSSLSSAPEHEDLGAQFGAEVHGGHRLLHGISANRRIVGSKCSVTKDGIVEQIHGRHWHADAMLSRTPL